METKKSPIFYLKAKQKEEYDSLNTEVLKSSISIFLLSALIALLPIAGIISAYKIHSNNAVYQLSDIKKESRVPVVQITTKNKDL